MHHTLHTHMQEKSRLDWMSYKRDEGLEEELSQHKKDGYECLATHWRPWAMGHIDLLHVCYRHSCGVQHSKEAVHNTS